MGVSGSLWLLLLQRIHNIWIMIMVMMMRRRRVWWWWWWWWWWPTIAWCWWWHDTFSDCGTFWQLEGMPPHWFTPGNPFCEPFSKLRRSVWFEFSVSSLWSCWCLVIFYASAFRRQRHYVFGLSVRLSFRPSIWRGFRAFPGNCMEGMACNFACWCILTTFRTD